jgi:hypothetical protein
MSDNRADELDRKEVQAELLFAEEAKRDRARLTFILIAALLWCVIALWAVGLALFFHGHRY